MTSFFILMLVLAPPAGSVGDIQIGILISAENQALMKPVQRRLAETLQAATTNYYRQTYRFRLENHGDRALLEEFEARGTRGVREWMAGASLDYLVFIRKSSFGQYTFEAWSKDGETHNVYLPDKTGIQPRLPRIATGFFLGLLEKLGAAFQKNKAY